MTDRVLLVTAPDDSPIDAIRILLVDLTQDHTQLINLHQVLTLLPIFGSKVILRIGC